MLRLIVGIRFQVLFHSAFHCSFHRSFTVLVRYRLSTILSLTRWSSRIRSKFLVYRSTWVPSRRISLLKYGAITLYGTTFQLSSSKRYFSDSLRHLSLSQEGPTTPYTQRRHAITCIRFRLFPVRSPLLRESFLLYFPPVTKMFQFTGLPSIPYVFRYG